MWWETCAPIVYAFHCGSEVKEAMKILTIAENYSQVTCTDERIEKIQPLVQHFEALAVEQQKLKQIKSNIKSFK